MSAASESSQAFYALPMVDEITLMIETDEGIIRRTVMPALPLPPEVERGVAAEQAIRFAAALWGMPDFIFDPAHEASGSGVREVGDGILVTSGTAVMIQSKSRQQSGDAPEKEANWLAKNISKGLRQGAGSIRFLSTRLVPMRNRRRRTVTLDGTKFAWVSVVLVDHDDVPDGYTPVVLPANAVVMMRRDWEFLFDQLRSARSVANYLKRVAGESIPLGTEPVRYHELAMADLAVEPPPAPRWAVKGASTVSVPQAPLEPAHAQETNAHFLLRTIQEDIALSRLPEEQELARIDVLSRLDSIPVASRTELGERLESYMSDAKAWAGDAVRTYARIYLPIDAGPFDSPIVFMLASVLNSTAMEIFGARIELLHHDFMSATGQENLTTVGVLLTPGTISGREWDTTMKAAAGDLALHPDYVQFIRDQLDSGLRV